EGTATGVPAMTIFDDLLNAPVTWREFLNWNYDASVWQAIARAIRGPYRRWRHPNGPAWFGSRLSSVHLIMALNRCSREEAEARQRDLDSSRLAVWLRGYG